MRISRRSFFLVMLLAGGALADTVQLRNGRRVEGTFVGGDTRQVRLMNADGSLHSYPITDIEGIRFGTAAAAAAAPLAAPAPARSLAPRPAAAAAWNPVVVPTGTVITVRLIDAVDSDVASVGEKFRASLDDPLQAGSQLVAPRGADVTVQIVRLEQSGRLTGRDEVALDVHDIDINGKKYAVATSYAELQSDSRGAQTAKRSGGGAALGAVIGAIAGGGRGAAIGAATGAGAGAAIQVLTKGQRVKIPAESRLDFTLKQPLSLE